MVIIETSVFTKRVLDVLSDEEYREFQEAIVKNPGKGELIPGGGGLRKLRWRAIGRGKRGGARVIYYWFVPDSTILMLFIFKKNERSDITKEQLKVLRLIVERELR
jgi:mRNA-degrading endonuclease RelE of RelBE toxin-antitoxin system